MVDGRTAEQDDWSYPSPKEMSEWLEREIADIVRASELRIRDAETFVTAYGRGDISSEETEKRGYEYSQRWGDALPGRFRSKGMSDEEILAEIDRVRATKFVDRVRKRPSDVNNEKSS